MKSIYKLLALAVVLAGFSAGLVGCGGGSNTTTPETPTESPSPETGTN